MRASLRPYTRRRDEHPSPALRAARGPADTSRRLWNTANIAFPALEAEAILFMLSVAGLDASACNTMPSPVELGAVYFEV